MPPTRRVLPRQKPQEASSGVHSSPFPSWANRSGLGPKSPVFKGGNGPHLFMLLKKIIARKRSGPQNFLEKVIDGKVQDRDEFPQDKKMAQV